MSSTEAEQRQSSGRQQSKGRGARESGKSARGLGSPQGVLVVASHMYPRRHPSSVQLSLSLSFPERSAGVSSIRHGPVVSWTTSTRKFSTSPASLIHQPLTTLLLSLNLKCERTISSTNSMLLLRLRLSLLYLPLA